MRKLAGWALIALALSSPARAQTHSPEVIASLECAAFFSATSAAVSDKTQQAQVATLATYFMGKAVGQEPGLDIAHALTPDFVKATASKFAQIQGPCLAEATALGEALKHNK